MQKIRTTSFHIEPLPPYRLDYTVWCLRRRPKNRVDTWDGTSYRRVLVLHEIPHLLCIEQTGSIEEPLLQVTIKSSGIAADVEEVVTGYCEKILGTRWDLTDFYRLSRQNAIIHQMVQQFIGMKPPRFPSVFESILNGIVCQQISLDVCIQLLSRLTEHHGRTDVNLSPQHAFPCPEDLSPLESNTLRAVGLSRQKSAAIIGLARRIRNGDLDLEHMSRYTDTEVDTLLRQIPGVGPWTARYVLLRGLGRLHIFPTGDVGAQNRLRTLFSPEMDDAELMQIPARFYPFGGLLYFHLLLRDLAERGVLRASSGHEDFTRGAPS
jgi:DNA-3-methyladenine glycosylase II